MLHRCRPRPAAAPALVALVVVASLSFGSGAASAQERPDFQLPFPCGDTWRLDTWAHAPALDMVREPDQVGTEGALLIAPADGSVVESFRHGNAGEVIQIDHGGGWFTTYIHLDSRAVSVGDDVAQGDEIGAVGRTGPTANDHPHLHFELAVDENGDGSASWGFAGSERVRPWFDGVEYGQSNGQTWREVESANCVEATEAEAPAAPVTETTTTAPATTTTTAAPTTTAPAAPATVAPAAAPTTLPNVEVAPATTQLPVGVEVETAASDGTLPRTGTSGTTMAAAVGAVLLGAGGALVLVRRRVASVSRSRRG